MVQDLKDDDQGRYFFNLYSSSFAASPGQLILLARYLIDRRMHVISLTGKCL